MAKSYEASGVNLEAGYEVVSRIKKHVKSTDARLDGQHRCFRRHV